MEYDLILETLNHYRNVYLKETNLEVRKWLVKIQLYLTEELFKARETSLIIYDD